MVLALWSSRRCVALTWTLVALLAPSRSASAQSATGKPVPAIASCHSATGCLDDWRESDGTVGPGDRIILRVWREPLWSDSLVVGTDGVVTLPRVGPFRVTGLTPVAMHDSVRARLAVFLRDPVIDLAVLRRVTVLGSVRKPNVYFVDPVTTLRDVIAQAGGADEVGDLNRIEVVRDARTYPVGRWSAAAERPAPIQSGDQVVVGKRPWFTRNTLAAVSSVAVAVSVLISATRR